MVSTKAITSRARNAALAAAALRGERVNLKPARAPRPKPVAKVARDKPIDATPERIAHAEPDGRNGLRFHDMVDAAIDKAGERALLTRRFRDRHIDRMRLRGQIGDAEWQAANWYREQFERSQLGGRVVASYGTVSGVGETSYGMPTTEAQARARQLWRKAREVLPAQLLAMVDDLVLHDQMPALRNGQQRARYASHITVALRPLADWLRVPSGA